MESSRARIIRLLGPWPFPRPSVNYFRKSPFKAPLPAFASEVTGPREVQSVSVPTDRKRDSSSANWKPPVFTIDRQKVILRGGKNDLMILSVAEFLKLCAYAHLVTTSGDRSKAESLGREGRYSRMKLPENRR